MFTRLYLVNLKIIFICFMHYYTVVASDVFYEFEKAFAGQIINPDDLLIKEKIGEGEHFTPA